MILLVTEHILFYFQVSSETSDIQISEPEDKKETKAEGELDLEETNLNVELKIVEDVDEKDVVVASERPNNISLTISEGKESNDTIEKEALVLDDNLVIEEPVAVSSASRENIVDGVSFPKIDIVKYRRNSSVTEDDIKLRRGNLEDFHALTTKRSKSLHNNLDTTYMTYDINLNTTNIDANGNEEPQKVVCKLYDEPPARKQSIDTVSSTEKEFLEIDKATRELEREISKLNSALHEDEFPNPDDRLSVSEIKKKFDKNGASSPNPIPKPRRSHYGGSNNSP